MRSVLLAAVSVVAAWDLCLHPRAPHWESSPPRPAARVAVRLGANVATPAAKKMRTRGPRVSFRVGHHPNGRDRIHSQIAPPWDAIMRSPTMSLRAKGEHISWSALVRQWMYADSTFKVVSISGQL